ncbi:hypothetical protein [Chlorogloeopsis fritschii]|nr:hypothetical protein [Chlorogloeopsis fritschii]
MTKEQELLWWEKMLQYWQTNYVWAKQKGLTAPANTALEAIALCQGEINRLKRILAKSKRSLTSHREAGV